MQKKSKKQALNAALDVIAKESKDQERNQHANMQKVQNRFVAPSIETGEVGDKKVEAIGCGSRIRRQRTQYHLTLDELSELTKLADPDGMGVSKVAISRYENADSLPGYRELKLLSHALGVPVSTFFYEESEDPFGVVRPTMEEIVKELVLRVLHERETAKPGQEVSAYNDVTVANQTAFTERMHEIRRKRGEN